MVKKYIIITPRICNMGGAQLYVLRRTLHLLSKGYEVIIIVSDHGGYFPLQEKFNGVPLYLIPETGSCIAKLTKKRQDEILNDIIKKVGEADAFYMETHTLSTIEWGEILSAYIHARHLAYPLAEPYVKTYKFKPGKKIFEEKLNKGEFYGCSSFSLKLIFGCANVPPHFINIGFDEKELGDYCTPSIRISKNKNDYIILTISRLEKNYIENLVDAASELASKYPTQNFKLLIAGGSSNSEREKYLKNNYNNEKYHLPNLDILYLGYITNLGRDIFNLSDVFVGMGTASINAISQNCIAINIDPTNNQLPASGIFGIDTNNFAYSENGKHFSIFEKLEEVYKFDQVERKRIQKIGRMLFEEYFEMTSCFLKVDEIICGLEPISCRKTLFISKFYRMVARFYLWNRSRIRNMFHI